jgi:hypothetical protein
MTGCCGAGRAPPPRVSPPYRRVNRTALGAAALTLPRPRGIRPFHGGPECSLLGPPGVDRIGRPSLGNRNQHRPPPCVAGWRAVGQLGGPMHGYDGGDAGLDPAGAVLVLLGQPGARESALRTALATCRAQVEITVVGQRAVHDQRICAGRGWPIAGNSAAGQGRTSKKGTNPQRRVHGHYRHRAGACQRPLPGGRLTTTSRSGITAASNHRTRSTPPSRAGNTDPRRQPKLGESTLGSPPEVRLRLADQRRANRARRPSSARGPYGARAASRPCHLLRSRTGDRRSAAGPVACQSAPAGR